MCLGQSALTYLTTPLEPGWGILAVVAALLPADVFFIALGLLCRSVLSDVQVGELFGALLANASTLLSGACFDLELVGSWSAGAAGLLPFLHAVDAGRAALSGDRGGMVSHPVWVSAWAAVTLAAFRRRMYAA